MSVAISGNPSIAGVVLTEQASTPSTPASGKSKLFVTAAGVLRLVDATGTAHDVGTAGTAYAEYAEMTPPAPPAADRVRLYAADKAGISTLYYVRSDGTTVELGAAAGAGTGRPFDPATTCFASDDFVTGPPATSTTGGALNWIGGGGGINASPLPGEANHPGITRLPTAAAVNNYAYLAGSGVASFLPAATFDCTFIFRQNLADATNGIRIGVGSLWSSEPVNGVYLEKLAADTSWFGTARAASVSTRTAALAAADAGWHRVRVRRVSGTTVGFTLDALTEVTLATGLPTAAVGVGMQIFNSGASAVIHTLDIDYADILLTALAR